MAKLNPNIESEYMRLSALIVAKNETKNIVECIKSVSFADEIIVIDDNSTDDTVELAKACGAQVFTRAMNGDWASQQNFSIEKATGDWLFLIDCDERVTPELAEEIQHVLKQDEKYAYHIRRLNFFGKTRIRFGNMRPDFVCRLMPNQGVKVKGLVHPAITHPYPEKKLKHSFLHYSYTSWAQYFRKFNQYTELSANKYFEEGRSVSFIRDVVLRPIWAFLKVYVFNLGFLDGKIGWVLAVNHYSYTLNKYSRFYYLKHPL